MNLFDVYSQYDIEPTRGNGAHVYTEDETEYLDFYGGHAVISVGHNHPTYVKSISKQLNKLGFYSNAVNNSLQQELADKLEALSGLKDYAIFYVNSGAEANENAIKLASFYNGRTKILALENGFHGRTSAAVRATHNFSIQAPINKLYDIDYLPINDILAFENQLKNEDVCAVLVEAIQGIGGCYACDASFLEQLSALCKKYNTILILDEIQCGYGRSGDFFSFQIADFRPDIITMAKGMGNGFPIGGLLINEEVFEAKKSMLGTTIGGNHLACAAGIAVLDIIKEENLIAHAKLLGEYFCEKLKQVKNKDFQILGRGLMIGLKFKFPTSELRKELLYQHRVFSGSSGDPNIMRILPPLNISTNQIDQFVNKLEAVLNK